MATTINCELERNTLAKYPSNGKYASVRKWVLDFNINFLIDPIANWLINGRKMYSHDCLELPKCNLNKSVSKHCAPIIGRYKYKSWKYFITECWIGDNYLIKRHFFWKKKISSEINNLIRQIVEEFCSDKKKFMTLKKKWK